MNVAILATYRRDAAMESPSSLTMIQCARKPVRLTPGACTKMWASAAASRPKEWEGRFACLGCHIGAAYNGQVVTAASETAEALHAICPRCARSGLRLIGKDLCVSCYNRDREATAGRDRKGHRPALADVLRIREIVVCQGGVTRVVQHRAVGLEEMMVRVAKTATARVDFTLPLPTWFGPQAMMPFRALPRPGGAGRRRRRIVARQPIEQQALPV